VRAAVCLFTRDLRIHDNPTLRAALDEAETVLPLFVRDAAILESSFASPTRVAFLEQSLADLDESLGRIGGRLIVRRGDVVAETVRAAREVDAEAVFCSLDVSRHAHARERRLAEAVDLRLVNAHFVVPPGELAPHGGDHYRVFTPYHRAWQADVCGDPIGAPSSLRMPPTATGAGMPKPAEARDGLAPGGEGSGRARMLRWLRQRLAAYGEAHDAPAADDTSRLSPYLHFGCVSARELAAKARERDGDAFVRQLCWRDFYAQLLHANPRSVRDDLRPRGDRWVDDPEALDAWREGRTGYPLVDAGMRQLAREGWMHNRARLVTASFLVKDLGIDWRAGAQHYFDLLLDGDVAQNVGNWQWVAGTGVDTRPNRVFNPTAQAKRLDPDGEYVRRYVEELADVADPLDPGLLAPSYPAPIVDHAEAARAFRERRRS
jgi:deoxyribodipyrimidine photo-lyase